MDISMTGHQAVLLEEAIEGLAIKPAGIYIDGTFGRGGHSQLILQYLNENGRLVAIDKDEEAIAHARAQLTTDNRFQIVQGSFADIEAIAYEQGIFGKVDGVLLDLGMSSPQLDDPARGFSFMREGPLDMRMDRRQLLDAKQFVNEASASEMALVFRQYGEERFAARIAKAIVEARGKMPISTTSQLAELVKAANPKWEKHKHPATRVFQAIRIHINQELSDLSRGLEKALSILAVGGRLVVISFHSLEDRVVKQFMRDKEQGLNLPKEIPLRETERQRELKRIGKAIMPTEDEVKNNVRSRSAVLRIGEKLL